MCKAAGMQLTRFKVIEPITVTIFYCNYDGFKIQLQLLLDNNYVRYHSNKLQLQNYDCPSLPTSPH